MGICRFPTVCLDGVSQLCNQGGNAFGWTDGTYLLIYKLYAPNAFLYSTGYSTPLILVVEQQLATRAAKDAPGELCHIQLIDLSLTCCSTVAL
jgi:hypothetical protein